MQEIASEFVLAVGVSLYFYGFSMKSSYFGLYLVLALKNRVQMVADLDWNTLKIL